MAWNYAGLLLREDKAKIVEISGTKENVEITNLQTVPISSLDRGIKNCISALPGKGTTFRILSFPFRQKKKILQVLPSELEDSIPFQLNEVIYDFQVWEKSRKSTTIIVTIVKKEEYESFVNEILKHNLRPFKIGVEALYLSPLFQFVGEDSQIGILDIEEDHSNLLLWDGEKKFFPRYLTIGSKQLTRMLMDKHSINDREAEALRSEGKTDEDTLHSYGKLLSAEILQTIFAYKNQTGNEIKKLYLSGPGAKEKNIAELLQKLTGIKCEILNLPIFPPLPPGTSQLDYHLPLAIALNGHKSKFSSEINFALPAEESEKEWNQLKPALITTASLYILLLLLLLISSIAEYSSIKSRYQKIKGEELQIVARVIPEEAAYGDYVNSLERKIEEMKKRLSSSQLTSNYSVLDVIKEISAKIPENVTLTITDFTIDGKNLRIKGETSDFTSLDHIRQALSKVKYLTNISIVDSKKLQKTGNISFTIVAKVGETDGTNNQK